MTYIAFPRKIKSVSSKTVFYNLLSKYFSTTIFLQVFLVSEASEMSLLNKLMLVDEVCVLENINLPDTSASKDTYSNIISKFR